MRVMMNSPWIQRALARAFGIQGRPPIELDSAASPTVQLAQLGGVNAGLILDHTPVIAYATVAAVVGERSFVMVSPPAGAVLVVDSIVLETPDGGAGNGPAVGVEDLQSMQLLALDVTATAQFLAMRGFRQQSARSRIQVGTHALGAPTPNVLDTSSLFYPPTWGVQLLGEGFAVWGDNLTDNDGWAALTVVNAGVNQALKVTVTGREYEMSQWLAVQ